MQKNKKNSVGIMLNYILLDWLTKSTWSSAIFSWQTTCRSSDPWDTFWARMGDFGSIRLLLFTSLNNPIRDKKFNDNDNLNQWLTDLFESKPTQFYVNGIHQFPNWWRRVFNADGDYLIDWTQILFLIFKYSEIFWCYQFTKTRFYKNFE